MAEQHQADHWRWWMGRHGPALVLFARQWSANTTDAEDAVQDGFVRFWQTRARARDQAAYLYACVRSTALDRGRGERRRERREQHASHGRGEASAPSAFVVSDRPERAEREAAIEAALNQLPADQREVIVMKVWGELTFAQIAQALGVPLNTAASRYRYGLVRLGRELSEEVAHD